MQRNVHVSCIFQRSTFTLLSLEVLCRVFPSSFFIIFVIYETVFIISYCSLAAADGLSTRKGNMPRPCSDFSKITRVFPYLLPCSFSIFSLATSLFCAFYQKFVFHSVCWPRLLQTFQWIERGKQGGVERGRGLPELVACCMACVRYFLQVLKFDFCCLLWNK